MPRVRVSKADGLTPKMRLFVEEYLVDFNAKEACIRAGYSKESARMQGYENMMKPAINKAVADAIAERCKRVHVNSDYVLERLVEIDQLDIIDIIDDHGGLRPAREWPAEWRRSISGVDLKRLVDSDDPIEYLKIKWPDKLKNLELLGKHVNVGAFEVDKGPADDAAAQPVKIVIDVVDGRREGRDDDSA